ncbi:uncharacterized protein At1g65710 isoform X2 [Medicago truncatula]|uniref:uncharacterized protein At1g65710 isoform X2 n=1 Tax=Medicago truncatula TaxID=3880 RepID=UPI0019682443|nr:uncharacterized protein At1g65710 isoform X2 [Medicago truncatula]
MWMQFLYIVVDSAEILQGQKNSDLYEDDWKEPAEKLYRNRRRTPSREREQRQRSSSRERRVSISPVRRSSDTTTPLNARNNTNTSSMPRKMVSVPATVTSLVMDKSNNNGCEGGESAAGTIGVKRITVRRNVGSPRSQSPARANGNATSQSSLSRSSSRKAEESPYRRNPLNELEQNSLANPHSTVNNNNSRAQSRPKKEIETEANKIPNSSRIALDKVEDVSCKTKLQDEDVKMMSSVTDNVVVKTVVVPPVVENLKPWRLTRSRSSRRSRDLELDHNPEDLLIPPQSYTSLLLQDIQNFHQKNTPPPPSPPPVSLPACVARACSIVEAVANFNSNSSSNLSGVEDRRNPPGFQSNRNEYDVLPGTSNSYGKRVADNKDRDVEYELIVYDDMVEPSLHKFETMNRGSSNMEEQESSGSNSLTVSSAKHRRNISSSSSWEPSSSDSKDCWTARLNNCKEEDKKSPLGMERRVSSVARRANIDGAKMKLNSKRRESDHQHDNETGRGRLGANNVPHMKQVVTAVAST